MFFNANQFSTLSLAFAFDDLQKREPNSNPANRIDDLGLNVCPSIVRVTS